MNQTIKFMAAIMGINPSSRAMRSFWVPNKNPFAAQKRSLRFVRRYLRFSGWGRIGHTATAGTRSRNAGKLREWRREMYLVRRRPFAGWAV